MDITCNLCGVPQPTTEFSGLRNRSYRCKTCCTKRKNEWRRQVRVAVLQMLGGCCCKCGYNKHPEILQADHIVAIGGGRHRTGDNTVRAYKNPELYQLMCPNCHALKTIKDKIILRNKQTKHSTPKATPAA